jgi:stearoyl-CoA desaturase (Delta-9 desaturase)
LEVWPAVALAVLCYLIGGWSGLVVGFCWSTVLVYHATFCINSLAHVHGRKRYVTGDDSRNNWLLAIFTMGEGWHNNHHAYQSSVRQGFKWWEFDATFYLLKVLSWSGLVWDLKLPPEMVLRNEHRLGSRVIERAAAQLAASFNSERIASSVAAALGSTHLVSLQERFAAAQSRASEALAGVRLPTREEISALTEVHLPHLPTREEIFARASEMFVRTPSFDAIVERAHELVLDAVWTRLRLQPLAIVKA